MGAIQAVARRRGWWCAATFVLLSIGAVIAAPSASGVVHACSCEAVSDAEAFARADVVFAGRLVGVEVSDGEIVGSADPARFRFDVDTVLKGEAFEVQSVVSARDGASCGLELPFGVDAVVFARTDSTFYDLADDELESDLCSGNRVGALGPDLGTPAAPLAVATEPSIAPSSAGGDDDTTTRVVVAVGMSAAALIGVAALARWRRLRGADTDASA